MGHARNRPLALPPLSSLDQNRRIDQPQTWAPVNEKPDPGRHITGGGERGAGRRRGVGEGEWLLVPHNGRKVEQMVRVKEEVWRGSNEGEETDRQK